MTEQQERFAIPGVGAIIEKKINGENCILVQDRVKNRPHEGSHKEIGLLEIPAGKINEFEDVYTCLRREVMEETGLELDRIEGEEDAEVVEVNGYRVLNYTPFSSSQNIEGYYPIIVQVFLCTARETPELNRESNETKNVRWEPAARIKELMEYPEQFYPMHITTLKKYFRARGI